MKKRRAKVGSFLLALVMIFSLAACGGSKEETKTPEQGSKPAETGKEANEGSKGSEEGKQPAETTGSELAAEQVFRMAINNEPATLDPWINNSGEAGVLVAAVHEPMLRKTNDEKGWEPALMTDYQHNDAYTVHTLTMREGVKWADGTPITMDDVVASFQRVLTPEMKSSIAYKYFIINNAEKFYEGQADASQLGVKAKDDKTLEITTSEPCDYFIDLLTAASFAPVQKAAAESLGDTYGTDVDKLMASGPFKVTEWVHKNAITLEKNENYWDAANVKLEKIEITITSDRNTVQGMYKNDELSILKVPDELLPQYADERIVDNPQLRNTFIEFNPNHNEFLANKNIREALSITFNRKAFAEQVMHNGALAAYGLVPYGIKGLHGGDFREQAGPVVKDASDQAEIDRAKELFAKGLSEIGKTKEDMEKSFAIQCLESGKVQAQAIQGMWKSNLGLEMPVSVLDFNVILPMLIDGTFDCVIGGGQDSDYRDPQGFMQFIYDENKWDNAEFKALVEKAHQQTGDERIQTWMDIEKMVLDNFIYIPQVYATNHFAIKANVQGLGIFTYGYQFDFKHVAITK